MALYSTKNLKAFDEVGDLEKHVKLGDKIYTDDENVQTIKNILNKCRMCAVHRSVDIAGKNVHEFTIRLEPVEQPTLETQFDHLLLPHYEEADLVN